MTPNEYPSGESLWWKLANHGREPQFHELPALSRWWRTRKLRCWLNRHGKKLATVQLPPLRFYLVAVPVVVDPIDHTKIEQHVEALVARTKLPPQPVKEEQLIINADTIIRFKAEENGVLVALVKRPAGEMGVPALDDFDWMVEEMIEITGVDDGAEYELSAGRDQRLVRSGIV